MLQIVLPGAPGQTAKKFPQTFRKVLRGRRTIERPTSVHAKRMVVLSRTVRAATSLAAATAAAATAAAATAAATT
ncbi:MAG TPA: hypothetical protein VM528_02345, partial [Burkholderiaceae bacterium]|nr:hypothetical protein [Burkholderiaceae bacterium]